MTSSGGASPARAAWPAHVLSCRSRTSLDEARTSVVGTLTSFIPACCILYRPFISTVFTFRFPYSPYATLMTPFITTACARARAPSRDVPR